MLHFRKIVFDMIEQGLTDEAIVSKIHTDHKMLLMLARIANYREAYQKLNEQERSEYVLGKRTLTGSRL